MSLKQEIATPLSDADIKAFLPEALILKYSELSKYPTLHDVLPEVYSYCFILYENSLNNGHWTVISRPEEGIAEYFDSYGGYVDNPLRWVSTNTKVGLGVTKPYLGILFRKTPEDVVYNKCKFQKEGENINDCGRWCVLRVALMLKGLNLDKFHDYIYTKSKKMKLTPDELVTTLVQ